MTEPNCLNLVLTRQPSIDGATPGELSIDGQFFCHTLEDQVREIVGQPVSSWKIPDETAIPKGRYRVLVTWSNRFQKFLPILQSVPGFTGIRIHGGRPITTANDTSGCILVGKAIPNHPAEMMDSRHTMAELLPIIASACDRGEAVFITIREGTAT